MGDWDVLKKEIQRAISIRGTFTIVAFSEKQALAEFGNEDDINEFLSSEEIYTSWCTLRCLKWSPRKGTVEPDYLKIRDRWVILKGIPFHLWSSEVFEAICEGFGRFRKYEIIKSVGNTESTLRVFVEKCDPTKIPAIFPPRDFGLAFPIKILIDPHSQSEKLKGHEVLTCNEVCLHSS